MRILTRVVQLLLGFVFGALMTFGHQATARAFDIDLAWGLWLAMLGSLALLVGVRLLSAKRTACFLVALGMLGAVALLALPGPGGSVLIPANLSGTIWAFAPTVIAILVLAWPNVSSRAHSRRQPRSRDRATIA